MSNDSNNDTFNIDDYPEHKKVDEYRTECETIGNFVDWLQSNGYQICRWRPAGNNGQPRYIPATQADLDRVEHEEGFTAYLLAQRQGVANPAFESWSAGFMLASYNTEEWIAQYLDIDLPAYRREKEAMYQRLMQRNKPSQEGPQELQHPQEF